MARIFISYARDDGSEIAKGLAHRLRELRHDVFVDVQSMPGSVEWEDELKNQISNSDLMVMLVTPVSRESDNVYWEFEQAKAFNKPILPIQIDNTPLPTYLRKINAKQLQNDNVDAILLQIFIILGILEDSKKIPPKRNRFVIPIIALLVLSVIAIAVVLTVNNLNRQPAPTEVAIVSSPTGDVIPLPENTDMPTDASTPTDEPSPTSEPTATETPVPPTPTNTPSSEPTVTEVSQVPMLVIRDVGASVHSMPSLTADTRIATIRNQRFEITGRTNGPVYYRVEYEGEEVWIIDSPVLRFEGDLSQVPVIESDAEATPTDVSLLLFEDFEDGEADSWQIYTGNFDVIETADGNYVWQAAGYALYVLPVDIYDYAFEAEVKQVSSTAIPAQAHLHVRIESGTNCYRSYSFYIDVYYQLFSLYETDYTCERAAGGLEGYYGVNITNDAWYTLKIVAEGDEISTYVDGLPVMTGESDRLQSNIVGIGIDGVNPSFYIDDIRIWSLE